MREHDVHDAVALQPGGEHRAGRDRRLARLRGCERALAADPLGQARAPPLAAPLVGDHLAGDAEQPGQLVRRDGVDPSPRDEERLGDESSAPASPTRRTA